MTSGWSTAEERKLAVRAVARMSADCTLPQLTPECPFFDLTADGDPACAEQCLDFISRYPDDQISRQEFSLGPGLGARRDGPKRRPPEADEPPFDGAQVLMEDQGKSLGDWRTVSIVVAVLRCAFTPNAVPDEIPSAAALLGELSERGIDLDRLLPALARRRALGVGIGLMMHAEGQSTAGSDFTARSDEWGEAVGDLAQDPIANLLRSDHLAKSFLALGLDACVTDAVPTRDEFLAAGSRAAIDHDVLDDGLWFFDRFAGTYVEDWSPSSRRREWEFIKARRQGCAPPGLMRSRVVSAEKLAELVAEDHCAATPNRPSSGASPAQFVHLAINKVSSNDFEQAVALFRAAREVWPDRGDLANNLGFCLIPVNAGEASDVLAHALSITDTPELTRLNLSVALHVAGQRDRCISEVGTVLRDTTGKVGGAMVWTPAAGGWAFESVDELTEYAEDLALHFLDCRGGCETFVGGSAPQPS